MKISHIEHLGIAVQSIEESLPFFKDVLGLECYATEVVEDQKVKTAFLRCGEVKLELLEPTSPESTIQKWLDKGNKGVHHVAFCVEDGVAKGLAEVSEKGVRLIDEKPRKGVRVKGALRLRKLLLIARIIARKLILLAHKLHAQLLKLRHRIEEEIIKAGFEAVRIPRLADEAVDCRRRAAVLRDLLGEKILKIVAKHFLRHMLISAQLALHIGKKGIRRVDEGSAQIEVVIQHETAPALHPAEEGQKLVGKRREGRKQRILLRIVRVGGLCIPTHEKGIKVVDIAGFLQKPYCLHFLCPQAKSIYPFVPQSPESKSGFCAAFSKLDFRITGKKPLVNMLLYFWYF